LIPKGWLDGKICPWRTVSTYLAGWHGGVKYILKYDPS
jgi:hypothetical protein